MGYTLELYAVRLERLTDELRRPSLVPDPPAARPETDGELLANWAALASATADAIGSGGGELTWPLSGYVHIVVRSLGSYFGSVWHTSSGGEDFRGDLFGGTVTDVLGPEPARHLVNRELVGLSTTDRPMFGWLTHAELRTLAGAQPDDVPPEHEDDLWTLIDAIDRAAATEQDLVTAYV